MVEITHEPIDHATLTERAERDFDLGARGAVADRQQLPGQIPHRGERTPKEHVGVALYVGAHHGHGEQPGAAGVQAEATGEGGAMVLALARRGAIGCGIDERWQAVQLRRSRGKTTSE